MDVLALDPATTAYLQARGHQEALMAALEGPDLSHGLDRTDRVGGARGLMGRGEANRKAGVGPHVHIVNCCCCCKGLSFLCPPQNVLMVKATAEVSTTQFSSFVHVKYFAHTSQMRIVFPMFR